MRPRRKKGPHILTANAGKRGPSTYSDFSAFSVRSFLRRAASASPFSKRLSGQDLLIVLQILLQKRRSIQTVRAFALTLSAVQAVFDLHHLLLRLRRQMGCGRGTADQLRHPGTVIDFNSCRTGPVSYTHLTLPTIA